MENIEILGVKIEKAVEKLKKLSEENNKLRLEVEYLRKENELSKKHMGEYAVLRKNAESAAVRIERIIKKIDTVKIS